MLARARFRIQPGSPMVAARSLSRGALVVLLVTAPAVWYACSERGAPAGPSITAPLISPDFLRALAIQQRHTDALLAIPGVVGTAIVRGPDGLAEMALLVEHAGIPGFPRELDRVLVRQRVTGRLMAFRDPTQRPRPVPLRSSGRPPAITRPPLP